MILFYGYLFEKKPVEGYMGEIHETPHDLSPETIRFPSLFKDPVHKAHGLHSPVKNSRKQNLSTGLYTLTAGQYPSLNTSLYLKSYLGALNMVSRKGLELPTGMLLNTRGRIV
jgi:hypothetical protein